MVWSNLLYTAAEKVNISEEIEDTRTLGYGARSLEYEGTALSREPALNSLAV